jgi:hypothetical protein
MCPGVCEGLARVITIFGKSGYSALSWQQLAEKLNLNTEDLRERFRANPDELRVLGEALPKKAAKAASGN